MARIKYRRFLSPVLLILLGIAVAIVLSEIVLRCLGICYQHVALVSDPVLHHRHPRSYTFTAYHAGGEYGGHPVRFNSQGLVVDPMDSEEGENPDAEYRIAFMGDSYVEALQVSYSDSFVGRLQAGAGDCAVINNFGVISYSPINYVLQWREDVRHFRPTHAFLLLYSNDVRGDNELSSQAKFSNDGELLAIPGPERGWLITLWRKSYVVRFIRKLELQIKWLIGYWRQRSRPVVGGYVEENPDISSLTGDLVLQLADEIRDSGAEFVLMAVPSKARLQGDYDNPSEAEFSNKCKVWAKEHSIEFVDLVPAFHEAASSGMKLFFEKDPHFNRNGQKVAADVLKRAYPDIFNSENTLGAR